MKSKRIISVILSILLTFTVCLCAFMPTANALLQQKGSITLHVADSKTHTPIKDAEFRIYLFAAAYQKGDSIGYTYIVPYDECKMDIDNLQDAYLPVHLTHYALTHSLEYTQKTSDADGYIVFDDLVPGIYLIVPTNIPDAYFMPSPFVVNIPLYNEHHDTWIFDINASPKMQILTFTEEETKTTYMSVKKEWVDDGSHPDKITVALLKNLEVYDVITLDDSNNWYYRWNDLPINNMWHIVEENVPDGFEVSYDISENTVTVTNTRGPAEEESTTTPPPVTEPDETTPVPPPATEPDETTPVPPPATEPDGSTPVPPTTEPDKLVHTGQLNWPVPVFSIAGLLLFSIGWAMLNFSKKEKCE